MEQFQLRYAVVFGRSGAGKTLFALNSPFKPVLFIDTENSSAPYRKYFKDDITYVDVDTYAKFGEELKKQESGKYRTLVTDGVSWITQEVTESIHKAEAAAAKKRAEKKKRDQGEEEFQRSQIFWSSVAKSCDNIVRECKRIAPLVIFTAYDRGQYLEDKIREPRCNPAFWRTADICIELVRHPNQRIPHGLFTFKNRFLQLPPRIPNITWKELLEWMGKEPINWKDLEAQFLVPEEAMETIFMPSEEAG